ncbi:MAG: 3,4-dihydroxy-2-butanone-4-phosphate synthase [Myxococcales bacterium]|nr:3,4-dihydroxy-2-butanone-4-phosphate synthase [Myxococcales bacterium]
MPRPINTMPWTNVRGAIEDIAQGKMVILVDDEDRENEGDLCMAAEKVTPEAINFMATHGRGLICLTLTEAKIEQLELPMMTQRNRSPFQTGFTVSIEAAEGVSTGISAQDRALTIQVATRPQTQPSDLVTPGHVFPIRARSGGVLVRTGQTEGSVDLSILAGLDPSGVICEIMNPDGTMARRPELEKFAEQHSLRIVTIAELVDYRLAHDLLVETVVSRRVSTENWGELEVSVLRSRVDGTEHLALSKGTLAPDSVPLVRVQSIDLPADLMSLVLSGGGEEFQAAMGQICDAGNGLFVYLVRPREGSRPLSQKLEDLGHISGASNYQQVGERLDLREFGIGAQILKTLGIRRFKLMSNSEVRIVGLEGFGLELVERVPLLMERNRNL